MALSASPAIAETALERVQKKGSITIGIHNRSPWGFKKEDGTVAGFSPDMFAAAMEPLGIEKVDFIIMDFGALIPSLLSKRIDAVASGMAVKPSRCEQVIFSDPDLAVGDGLLVKEGNPLDIHSYDDIIANPKIKLGGGRGSSNSENARQAGVPEDQMELYQDIESGVTALLAGRVDALTFSSPTVISILKDPNIKGLTRADPFVGLTRDNGIPVAGFAAIAFHPDDTAIRDAYNARRQEMRNDGTVMEILERYDFTEAEAVADGITAQTLCPDNYK